jgi:ubiquitin carboxyl-terminal hydrolase 9/13
MICLCQRTCICLSSILIMARSKWISFGAHQPAKSQAGTSQSSLASPRSSPADAKKFGLENVSIHLLDRSALRSTFPVCQHLVSCLHSHTPVCRLIHFSYACAVLQALYFCAPFRDLLLQDAGYTLSPNGSHLVAPGPDRPIPSGRRKSERKVGSSFEQASQSGGVPIPPSPPTLYSALQSLFLHISTSPGDKGSVAPRAFIDKLKELNELFRSTMHQDAHEFLIYLLNQIVEEMELERHTSNVNNGEDCESLAQA